MNPFSVRNLLTDPQGSPGHLDIGWVFLIGEDNWATMGQTLRLWDLSQPFTRRARVATCTPWPSGGNDSYVQPTMGNGGPATMATVGGAVRLHTTTSRARRRRAPYGPRARNRLLPARRLRTDARRRAEHDRHGRVRRRHSVLPGAEGQPRHSTGEYYYWITNLGGSRLEAFIVRVPWQVLMGAGSGDSTPPDVTLTTPSTGATVSGTTTVSANATDNVGVAAVQFQVDGINIGAEDTASPYSVSWNTTGTANGAHTVTALARDSSNNWRISSAVSVTVSNVASGDTTQPNVSMTSPANGATVSGSVNVSASASDNVGVTGVQFLLDGANIGGEDTTSPYAVSWTTTGASNGGHTLTAVARDAAGNTRTASAVSVTVQNQAPGDTTQPTVSMTAPASGSTLTGTVTVAANAADNVGVAGVQFLLDGQNLGAEDTSGPVFNLVEYRQQPGGLARRDGPGARHGR